MGNWAVSTFWWLWTMVFGLKPLELSGWDLIVATVYGGQGETGCSRMGGGTIHKQGSWRTRLGWGGHKMSTSLPFLYLKVFTYSAQALSTMHCPLRAASLKVAPPAGTVSRRYIPRTGEEVRRHWWPRSSLPANWRSCLLDDLLQRYGNRHWCTSICLCPCFQLSWEHSWKVHVWGQMEFYV